MADTNPVSPKVVWAGIGSVVGPILVTIVTAFVDVMKSGTVVIPEPWQTVIYTAAALIGAVFGAYIKTDPLRLPTLEPAAVQDLPNAGQQLTTAADKLAAPPLP